MFSPMPPAAGVDILIWPQPRFEVNYFSLNGFAAALAVGNITLRPQSGIHV
jgi:hypothetical protein